MESEEEDLIAPKVALAIQNRRQGSDEGICGEQMNKQRRKK